MPYGMCPVRVLAFSTERCIPNGMQRKFIEFNSPAFRGDLGGLRNHSSDKNSKKTFLFAFCIKKSFTFAG